jgi:hypothetical protein
MRPLYQHHCGTHDLRKNGLLITHIAVAIKCSSAEHLQSLKLPNWRPRSDVPQTFDLVTELVESNPDRKRV